MDLHPYYRKAALSYGVPEMWLEDAAQDIALSLWLSGISSCDVGLWTTATSRKAVDAARKYGRVSRRGVGRVALSTESDADGFTYGLVAPDLILPSPDTFADRIARLPHRWSYIMGRYYRDEKSMIQIACELGVSRSRVSQIILQALEKIRRGGYED